MEGNCIHQVTLPRIHGLLVQEPSPHGCSTPGSETILRPTPTWPLTCGRKPYSPSHLTKNSQITPGNETILRWISVFFVEPAESFNKLLACSLWKTFCVFFLDSYHLESRVRYLNVWTALKQLINFVVLGVCKIRIICFYSFR